MVRHGEGEFGDAAFAGRVLDDGRNADFVHQVPECLYYDELRRIDVFYALEF